MLKRLKSNKWLWPAIYGLVGITAVVFYIPAREVMISQTAWVHIIKSNVTFNFMLFFFLWGMVSDNVSKRLGWGIHSWKSWTFFVVSLLLILVFFKNVGHYQTIFDK